MRGRMQGFELAQVASTPVDRQRRGRPRRLTHQPPLLDRRRRSRLHRRRSGDPGRDPEPVPLRLEGPDGPAVIERAFFDRSVHEIAPDLIGVTLLVDGVGGPIVEVEAYHPTEPASHAYRGPDAAQRRDVRPARARLRLPLVRNPLVPELRLRGGGRRGRGADPGARAHRRYRADGGAPPHDRTRGCSRRGPAASARRSESTGAHDGLPLDRAAVRAAPSHRRARDRHRPADRDHARRRAARGATCWPARGSSAAAYPERDRKPGRGREPGLRAAGGRSCHPIRAPPAPASGARASRVAFASGMPTTSGITPCSGFANTSVTLSNDESRPFGGNCLTTTWSACPPDAGL